MPATQATSIADRREMLRLVEEGYTLAAAAEQIGVSFWMVRKWVRIGRSCGSEHLASRYGRPRAGPLAGFDPLIRYGVLRLKRQHPKWGTEYVRKKLGERPSLQDKMLPSPVTIWRYWRSFGVRLFPKREPTESKISRSTLPHGVWQLDAKESISRVLSLHRSAAHANARLPRCMGLD
jgi:hypothetical protein